MGSLLRRLLLRPVQEKLRSRAFWHEVLDLAQDVVDEKVSPQDAGIRLLAILF